MVPPTGYSAYVGRVGALAVALGIGAAVAGWSGIPTAYADTPSQEGDNQDGGGGVETGGNEPGAPAGGVETPAASSSRGPIARLFPHFRLVLPGIPLAGQLPVNNSVSSPFGPSDGQQSAGGQRPTFQLPTRQRGQRLRDAEPAAAPTIEHVAAAETSAPRIRRGPLSLPAHSVPSAPASLAALGHDAVASAFSAPGLTHPTAALQSASLVAPTPRMAAPTGSVLGVIARVLSGFGATPGPRAPMAPSPALWTLLGFVRRDFERRFDNHGPVANPTQTGQTTVGGKATVTGTVGPSTDVDGDKLTYSLNKGPATAGSSVVVTPDGHYTYTASPAMTADGGTDTFQVAINDGPGNPPHVHGLPGLIHDLVAVANPVLAERLYPGGGDVTITTVTVVVAKPTGPVNHAPTLEYVDRKVDPTTGSVSVHFTAADSDGDPLHFTVTKPTAGGATGAIDTANPGSYDSATGIYTYTYTPTPDERLAATLTPAKETVGFTVSVTDQKSNPVTVTVGDVAVTELTTNSVIATQAVGGGPTATAYGPNGRTYVVNTNDDTVTVLNDNVANPTPVGVGDRPVAITIAADGNAYVANADGHSITRINPTTLATTDFQLGVDGDGAPVTPTGIAVNPAGTIVYTSNTNSTISVLKLSDGTVTTIAVDPTALEFSSDGHHLYAVDTEHDLVAIVDVDTGNVERVDVGDAPAGIAIQESAGVPRYAYVTNSGSGTVSVIDLQTNTKLPQDITVGSNPQGIAITPDGSKVYVANYGSGTVSVINTADKSITTVTGLGANPYDIAINAAGTQATITNPDDNKVTILVLTGNNKPAAVINVNAPDFNGVVTGSVTGTDADGDALTYSVTTAAAHGSLAFDPTDGSFTYTPDPVARHAAAATSGVDTDSFTITIDDNHGAQTPAVVGLEIKPQNTDPTAGATVFAPANGVVVGSVNGSDADGDVLHYTIGTGTTRGDVIVAADGGFVYTPSDSSRYAAAATSQSTFDSFTVLVDDGHGGQIIRTVDVLVAPAGVVGAVSNPGLPGGGVTFSPNGDRAVQLTYYQAVDGVTPTPTLTVIDTATGQAVGIPIDLPPTSGVSTPSFSADGSRAAVLVTTGTDFTNLTTHLTLVDTATGAEIGDGVDLAGFPSSGGRTVFSANGDRAIVTTMTTDDGSAAARDHARHRDQHRHRRTDRTDRRRRRGSDRPSGVSSQRNDGLSVRVHGRRNAHRGGRRRHWGSGK